MNYEENLRDKVLESADKTDEIASRLENAMNAGEAEGIDYPAPRRLSLELLGQLSTTVQFAKFYNEQFPNDEEIMELEQGYSQNLDEFQNDFQNALGGTKVEIIKE